MLAGEGVEMFFDGSDVGVGVAGATAGIADAGIGTDI